MKYTTTMTWWPLLIAALLALTACGSKDNDERPAAPAGPAAIETAECAACGMVVREQPAPRGQIVHRDGTRAFFCSLDDLRQYALAPSRHGEIVETYVETVADDLDPATTPVDERPWSDAADAHYVVGVSRPGIMGPPALAYASAAAAQAAAAKHAGRTLVWKALLDGAATKKH